jgi:MFS family permease
MSTLVLGANLVWISYNTVLLPVLAEDAISDNKGLVVGITGFVGMILATVASILAGIITDHNASRLGKRTPGIVIGGLASFLFIVLPSLLLLPGLRNTFLAAALPILMLSYCGMQIATNIAGGAGSPLLADLLPENQRGAASGIAGFYTLTGAAAGIILVTALNQNGQTTLALWFIAGIFLLTSLHNAFVIRGADRPADPSRRIGIRTAVRDMFRVRTRVVVFFWMVLAVFLVYVGINSLQLFGRFVLQVYFPTINPDMALRTLGGINLSVTMLAAVASGVLSDRFGRRPLLLAGMFLSAITSLFMGVAGNYTVFLILAAIRSAAMGPLVAIAPALASDLAPKEEAGQYMAYNNLSTALSGALASLIFGLILIDMTRTAVMWLFLVSAVFFLLGGIIFVLKVSQRELAQKIS